LHGLDACYQTNPSNTVSITITMMANLVQAVLGAVYVDSDKNIGTVKAVMDHLGLQVVMPKFPSLLLHEQLLVSVTSTFSAYSLG